MNINFNTTLKQLDGSDLLAEPNIPLTLARICSVALINDETGDGAAKERRYRMATKLFLGGVQDISIEDVAWLKEIVGRVVTSTLHAGQALLMFDVKV